MYWYKYASRTLSITQRVSPARNLFALISNNRLGAQTPPEHSYIFPLRFSQDFLYCRNLDKFVAATLKAHPSCNLSKLWVIPMISDKQLTVIVIVNPFARADPDSVTKTNDDSVIFAICPSKSTTTSKLMKLVGGRCRRFLNESAKIVSKGNTKKKTFNWKNLKVVCPTGQYLSECRILML